MRKILIATALVATAAAASAQQKPPAHFPGSKGSRAGEYAARYAAWQRTQPQHHQPTFVSADQPGIPPALRTKEEKPAPTPATVSKDIDDLDAKVRGGLADLTKAVEDLEKDRKDWAKLDKTVQTARTVNTALLKRAEGMLKTYDDRIGPALTDLKTKLKEAPDVYRKMAADRRAKAAAATFRAEQEAYETQAEFCETAAALCVRRSREVFDAADVKTSSAADVLSESMTRVRRMSAAHKAWAEVLDSWPSTLNDPKLADMVDQLNRYCEDMIAQQKGMAKLTDALKATAAEGKK